MHEENLEFFFHMDIRNKKMLEILSKTHDYNLISTKQNGENFPITQLNLGLVPIQFSMYN